ncbi:hypothetical protein RFI_23353 [Reticulomyxa filosa]|uniref:Uncharacterized protein n=1 Tax=Reticulomyxa filosa TaxID=46433 RepID=X6MJI9_RETFI|nr:hypothetical protein RFI_23353 [Reticulomyxa filosa]|eukprot:ETO14014.1 hypothetical protein RFI_23353 [Reticulomyxa filosa]
MNLDKSARGGLEALRAEYEWFAHCGNQVVPRKYRNKPLFIYFAADTAKAQSFAESVFGKHRVYFRPFVLKGSTLQGIIDAVVDLVTVSSFDTFISTPHSSYSEMSSLLGQPRRILTLTSTSTSNSFSFSFSFLSTVQTEYHWYSMPVNRPIVPMMTHTPWEIEKFNLYMLGRAIDIDLADPSARHFPLTAALRSKIPFRTHNICKLQVAASMGWIGVFDAFQHISCYNPLYHHPGSWFPLIGSS